MQALDRASEAPVVGSGESAAAKYGLQTVVDLRKQIAAERDSVRYGDAPGSVPAGIGIAIADRLGALRKKYGKDSSGDDLAALGLIMAGGRPFYTVHGEDQDGAGEFTVYTPDRGLFTAGTHSSDDPIVWQWTAPDYAIFAELERRRNTRTG